MHAHRGAALLHETLNAWRLAVAHATAQRSAEGAADLQWQMHTRLRAMQRWRSYAKACRLTGVVSLALIDYKHVSQDR